LKKISLSRQYIRRGMINVPEYIFKYLFNQAIKSYKIPVPARDFMLTIKINNHIFIWVFGSFILVYCFREKKQTDFHL